MKIPGKLPFKTITDKYTSDEKKVVYNTISGFSTKNIVSINPKDILYKKDKKSFSVKLLNYVEPYLFKGQRYTLFYSEVDHNLKINDRVFINGGFYDSDTIIQKNKFSKQSDGYIVQYVDRTKIVLDIEYTGDLPWNDEPVDSFVKVYVASTQDEFNYFIQTTSTRNYTYTNNRFSSYGTYSNNYLYIDGTFSLSGRDYGIFGFTSNGTSSLTYSNSFLILSGTSSGYLEDVTEEVLIGQRDIISGHSVTKLGYTSLVIDINRPHNLTNTEYVELTISGITGSGSYSYWNGTRKFISSGNTSLVTTEYGVLPTAIITGGLIKSVPLFLNGKLKIMNKDFKVGDISFKKGYSYYYDKDTWKVDKSYSQPIITEQNFRNGSFKKGQFNQGLIGTYQEIVEFNGKDVDFTLGTTLNVNWNSGNLGKGKGSELSSYFTSIDDFGLPSIKVNDSNNGGLGYNFIYNSSIKNAIIENGNFIDSIFGSVSNISTLSNYLTNTNTEFNVTLKSGSYINSKIYFSEILNSSIFSSLVSNSKIFSSKSVNSEIEKSLFLKSKYTSDKIIKILDYDEKFVNWYNDDTISNYKLYKFYISQDNFNRLTEFQNFYIDGLSINLPNIEVLNFFDDKFSIDSYKSSFDTIANKSERKFIIQLSTKDENLQTIYGLTNSLIDNPKYGYPSIDILAFPGDNFNSKISAVPYGDYKFDISPLTTMTSWGVTPSNIELVTSQGTFTFSGVTSSLSLYNGLINTIGSWTYSNTQFSVNPTYSYSRLTFIDSTDGFIEDIFPTRDLHDELIESSKILDISKAYIIDSDFKSGLFKSSTWISGNYINYNKDYSFSTLSNSERYPSSTLDSLNGKLIIPTSSKLRKDTIENSDIAFLNGIYYDTYSQSGGENLVKLPDTYKVTNIYSNSGRNFELIDAINGTNSMLYKLPSFQNDTLLLTKHAENAYNYLHSVKFDDSVIQSGIFRRAYFKGCILENTLFDNSDKNPVNYDNWRSLLVSDILFTDNNNKIKSGLVINSSFVSGSDQWENGILFNSIWNVQSFTWSMGPTSSSRVYQTPINKFMNGVVSQSRWVNGIFANGNFYKNRSNTPYQQSVYFNKVNAYYRNKGISFIEKPNPSNVSSKIIQAVFGGKTRYAWINGIFENGTFELSTFENGLFKDGDFFNSTFLDGEASGGNFGKRNLKYPLTRVSSGTFSNINVISAEFRSENPNGSFTGTYSINWNSGLFNNGLFGVKIDSASYSEVGLDYSFKSIWKNGTFINGIFDDTAIWQNGKFNNGKFTSYYGYPFVTVASYSLVDSTYFAWQNGEFNGGEFGNANTGTNSTWYNGEFNGGFFKGRYWNDGTMTRGTFFGSGTLSTTLSNIPQYVSNFSDYFYGLWNNGLISPVKNNKRIADRTEREFTKEIKRSNVQVSNILWRNGTFSHNDAIMDNSVWLNGTFQNGTFYKSSFNPYVNYLVNGNLQLEITKNDLSFWDKQYTDYILGDVIGAKLQVISNSDFSNDITKSLIFTGTSSITNIYQTTGLTVGENYTIRLIVNQNYNNEIRFGNSTLSLRNRNFTEGTDNWIIGATSQSGGDLPSVSIIPSAPGYIEYSDATSDGQYYLIYPGILEIGRDYTIKFYTFNESNMGTPYIGSCDVSQVSIEENVLLTSFVDGVNATYSLPNGSNTGIDYQFYSATITAEYTDFFINYRTSVAGSSVSINNIIVTSNISILGSDVSSKTSYSYSFNAEGPDFAIEFIPKAISTSTGAKWNIATSSIADFELVKGDSGFNISEDCRWENGIFDESEFYISKWNNGKWISGTGIGMIWKNGVSNYMNAYNVYWEGGTWRNGNWNGSPFSLTNINENGCSYNYLNFPIGSLSSPWDGLDLYLNPAQPLGEALIRIDLNTLPLKGFTVSALDSSGSFYNDYRDEELNPDNSGNFVSNFGLPFVKVTQDSGVSSYSFGQRYKVTINIGTVSIANSDDLEKCGFQFSIGRPGSVGYGELTATYSGSLYPSSINVASSEDFISDFYKLEDLDGHIGSVIPDLLISNVDGYLATTGGSFSEIVSAKDDGSLYIHFNLYGVSELWVKSIDVREEICNRSIEVNEGYASDILTNISIYRQSIGDSSYKEIFINDAFTVSIDNSFLPIKDQTSLSSLSFTQSGAVGTSWKYSTTYNDYTLFLCDDKTFAWKDLKSINNTNFYTDSSSNSNSLYALNTSGSKDIFTQSGEYSIEIKYIVQYSSTVLLPYVDVKFQISVGYLSGFDNGGHIETITKRIDVYKIGCTGLQYFGKSDELSYTYTFNPTQFTDISDNSKTILIKKLLTSPGTKVIITSAGVTKKSTQYDMTYNNSVFEMFDTTPSYSDQLLLPTIVTNGPSVNGNIVSTRFGNGIFTSGTSSAFSSIWENGVWNEGYRYDKFIYAFDDISKFSGTSKPYSFSGKIDIKKVKDGSIASDLDSNLTKVDNSKTNWIITLNRTKGHIYYDNLHIDQLNIGPKSYFKIGDKVSVGNIVSVDINGKRKLIRDYFSVIGLTDDLLILQVSINLPIRGIEKDSSDHLIYVTKNIWINGAFLNGIFRGVWNNGLFKGRPYLTKMIDSQWIDGNFDGGRFRGLTLSVTDDDATLNLDNTTEVIYPSALIQNFNFKDNNIGSSGFKYDSWIDVNYFKSSAVAINKDTILQNPSSKKGTSFKFSQNNFYGYPTKDILSSISYFRNGYDDKILPYNLGMKYERYEQYIPLDGEFKKPFDNVSDYPGLDNFLSQGWTFSDNTIQANTYAGETLYRLKSNISDSTSGIFDIQLNNYSHASNGLVYEDGWGLRIDNHLTDISNSKYTMVEFKINYTGATYNAQGPLTFPLSLYSGSTAFGGPATYSLIDPFFTNGVTYSYLNGSYPINHLATDADVKVEYFYSRPELNLYFNEVISGGLSNYKYDFEYIKYTEVDMIPFFRYATASRINDLVSGPYMSTAPKINYQDSEFSFIDSIVITETSFDVLTNVVTIINSGGGFNPVEQKGLVNIFEDPSSFSS